MTSHPFCSRLCNPPHLRATREIELREAREVPQACCAEVNARGEREGPQASEALRGRAVLEVDEDPVKRQRGQGREG